MFRFYTMAIDAAKPGSIRSRAFPARSKAAAALVHAYTASGAILAFLGIDAVYRSDVRFAFAMMLLATVVDATDGALARRARVKEVLPAIDGAHLDDIVDYLTFVLLPMLLAHHEGLFPAALSPWIVSAVLLSSAYGFTAADAKTSDYFFTGFPSYWNVAVLYLIALRSPAAVNAAVVAALVALVFVRIGYVYPSRTPVLKRLTLALAWLWGLALGVIVWMLPAPPRPLAIVSLAFPVYYTVLSLVLHARRPAAVIHT